MAEPPVVRNLLPLFGSISNSFQPHVSLSPTLSLSHVLARSLSHTLALSLSLSLSLSLVSMVFSSAEQRNQKTNQPIITTSGACEHGFPPKDAREHRPKYKNTSREMKWAQHMKTLLARGRGAACVKDSVCVRLCERDWECVCDCSTITIRITNKSITTGNSHAQNPPVWKFCDAFSIYRLQWCFLDLFCFYVFILLKALSCTAVSLLRGFRSMAMNCITLLSCVKEGLVASRGLFIECLLHSTHH